MEWLVSLPLLILDDLGMRKLPLTAAEDLLEIIMRRYERASTIVTSNRPVEDWGKLLGDAAAVTTMLDRVLHHGHVLKCGPRSWRTKTDSSDTAGEVPVMMRTRGRGDGLWKLWKTRQKTTAPWSLVWAFAIHLLAVESPGDVSAPAR